VLGQKNILAPRLAFGSPRRTLVILSDSISHFFSLESSLKNQEEKSGLNQTCPSEALREGGIGAIVASYYSAVNNFLDHLNKRLNRKSSHTAAFSLTQEAIIQL